MAARQVPRIVAGFANSPRDDRPSPRGHTAGAGPLALVPDRVLTTTVRVLGPATTSEVTLGRVFSPDGRHLAQCQPRHEPYGSGIRRPVEHLRTLTGHTSAVFSAFVHGHRSPAGHRRCGPDSSDLGQPTTGGPAGTASPDIRRPCTPRRFSPDKAAPGHGRRRPDGPVAAGGERGAPACTAWSATPPASTRWPSSPDGHPGLATAERRLDRTGVGGPDVGTREAHPRRAHRRRGYAVGVLAGRESTWATARRGPRRFRILVRRQRAPR